MNGRLELATATALFGMATLTSPTGASFALVMAGTILLGIGLAKSHDLSDGAFR